MMLLGAAKEEVMVWACEQAGGGEKELNLEVWGGESCLCGLQGSRALP